MFKEINDTHNKKRIYQVWKVSQIKGKQDLVHIIWKHYFILDEDNALIGTSENNEESQLYISYNSDSHERSDHNDANKIFCFWFL